jgi:lysophospholipase L1-like esterase
VPGSTFNMLVVGDSVMWGQGLREPEKFYSLVKAAIQERNPGVQIRMVVRAHSGATIGFSKPGTAPRLVVEPVGEVPTRYPTIKEQVETFTGPPSDDAIDLVLVDGGINDVEVHRIINPQSLSEYLESKIHQACYLDFKQLLGLLCDRFDKAWIIATGYYPIVSPASNLWSMNLLWGAVGLQGLVASEIYKAGVIANCRQFANRSFDLMSKAVFEVKTEHDRRIDFVYPLALDDTRAVFTDDPWIFGINADLTPQDPVAEERRIACENAVTVEGHGVDLLQCDRASLGHPNQKGARAYATAIIGRMYPATPVRLNVQVSPSPVPFGEPTTIVVTARDSRTQAPVQGSVTIRNFDIRRRPVYQQFATGVPYATTFLEGTVRVFDPETRQWHLEPAWPSGVVNARAYPDADIPFGWASDL